MEFNTIIFNPPIHSITDIWTCGLECIRKISIFISCMGCTVKRLLNHCNKYDNLWTLIRMNSSYSIASISIISPMAIMLASIKSSWKFSKGNVTLPMMVLSINVLWNMRTHWIDSCWSSIGIIKFQENFGAVAIGQHHGQTKSKWKNWKNIWIRTFNTGTHTPGTRDNVYLRHRLNSLFQGTMVNYFPLFHAFT